MPLFKCGKIAEGLVPNLSDPITCSFSDRRGRTCTLYAILVLVDWAP